MSSRWVHWHSIAAQFLLQRQPGKARVDYSVNRQPSHFVHQKTRVREEERAYHLGTRWSGYLLLVCVLLVTACGETTPTIDVWRSVWEQTLADMPAESDLVDAESSEICGEALGNLRLDRVSLFPAPDKVIAETTEAWLSLAESTLFECPPSGGFDEAYRELGLLEAEVEDVLRLLEG